MVDNAGIESWVFILVAVGGLLVVLLFVLLIVALIAVASRKHGKRQ